MRVTQIEYGRTVNTGNYESFKLSMVATVDETEHWEDVLDAAKEAIDSKADELKKPKNQNLRNENKY